MKASTFLLICFCCLQVHAQSPSNNTSNNPPPALSTIRESDLKHDLYYLASDSMRGRRAGTLDELKAAAWLAQQAQKAGLQPAGDNGTYFQYFSLLRTVTSANSEIEINGTSLQLWKDAWVTEPVETSINGSVLWLSSLDDTAKPEITGCIVAMTISPPTPVPPAWMSLWGFRYVYIAIRQQSDALKRHGASAILLVADSTTSVALTTLEHVLDFEEGSYDLPGDYAVASNESDSGNAPYEVPVIVVSANESAVLQQPDASVTASLHKDSYTYPSVNVVAKLQGTDANLRNEYVLFSGHHDHDGEGAPVEGDSIWNGADDNASVCVALLAIGRAFVKKPPKRSALFVWHGAEERGLYGSQWYVQHPTVPKDSIVAVINADMIGRNHPDSAALLGVTAPHRNAMDLVNAAYKANEQTGHFKIDTTWDNTYHPEHWYFRSDHLPYAQAGIPSIFFTTLLHPDYHTPKDEADRIDYPKLTRMTQWMYATGWMISNAAKRPALDTSVSIR